MKKFLIAFALLFCVFVVQTTAQYTKPTKLTLSTSDTIKGGVTTNVDVTIGSTYYWSLEVFYDYIAGTTDTCTYTLEESVDGVHYTAVVGAPTKTFTADGSYTWTGGSGDLPLVWPSTHLRLAVVYSASDASSRARPYIYLELKPANVTSY